MSRGSELLAQLKDHVVEQMRREPACAPEATGLGNNQLEELCELGLHLDAQDHYLMYSILHALVKEGRVEQVRWPNAPTRPKYRLRQASGRP